MVLNHIIEALISTSSQYICCVVFWYFGVSDCDCDCGTCIVICYIEFMYYIVFLNVIVVCC